MLLNLCQHRGYCRNTLDRMRATAERPGPFGIRNQPLTCAEMIGRVRNIIAASARG